MSDSEHKLPISIDPCPIKATSIEVRFDPAPPPEAVFGIIYQGLKEYVSAVEQLPAASLPFEMLQQDPTWSVQPQYKLIGKELLILVGPHTVTLVSEAPYPGWHKLALMARDIFAAVDKTGAIKTPTRFGLRYVTYFDGDVLDRLTLDISIATESAIGKQTYLKTVLGGPDCPSLLQIMNNTQLMTDSTRSGTVIDIDTFTERQPLDTAHDLNQFLEHAHVAEKELFFKLLKPDFLTSLNPKY
jgi:uncharacterized protein (TIGR04255 family)